jgi:hypothetical protein
MQAKIEFQQIVAPEPEFDWDEVNANPGIYIPAGNDHVRAVTFGTKPGARLTVFFEKFGKIFYPRRADIAMNGWTKLKYTLAKDKLALELTNS